MRTASNKYSAAAKGGDRPFRTTYREMRRWRAIFLALCTGGAGLSVWVTGEGLVLLIGQGPMPWALALFGGALSVAFYAYLYDFVPRAKGVTLAGLGAVAALLAAFVLCTSTLLGVVGQSAPAALRVEAELLTRALEEEVEVALRSCPADDAEIARGLKALEKGYLALAKAERDGGPVSGKKGGGTTSAALEMIADAYGSAASLMEAESLRREGARAEAETALATTRDRLRDWNGGLDGLAEARSGLADGLRGIEDALADLRRRAAPEDSLAAVDAAIRQLEGTQATGGSAKVRERREAAKASVLAIAKKDREKAGQDLDAKLGGLPETSLSEPELPRPMEAVAKHWREVAVLAAYPLAIDLLPLLALACLAILQRGLGAGKSPKPGLGEAKRKPGGAEARAAGPAALGAPLASRRQAIREAIIARGGGPA